MGTHGGHAETLHVLQVFASPSPSTPCFCQGGFATFALIAHSADSGSARAVHEMLMEAACVQYTRQQLSGDDGGD